MNISLEKLKKIGNTPINLGISKSNKKYRQDIDFFLPYKTKNREEKSKSKIYIAIIASLAVIIAGGLVYNLLTTALLKNEISGLKKTMSKGDVQEKVNLSMRLSRENEVLKKYYDGISKVSLSIEHKRVITSDLLYKITSCMPSGVSFKSMGIDESTFQIQGSSNSREDIADYLHQLKQLDGLYDVQVSTISSPSSSQSSNLANMETGKKFAFTLKCNLKDVDVYENK